ncbi:hypothetical protein, partial [Agrobacterium fabrum]|uniref:hypothetical protein n=1 Tax=Agrobacterium fabrum TaxID=1176649 RepID=UPI001AED00D7
GKSIPGIKYKYTNICINSNYKGIIFRLHALQRVLPSCNRMTGKYGSFSLSKVAKMIDYRGCVREPLRENTGNITNHHVARTL